MRAHDLDAAASYILPSMMLIPSHWHHILSTWSFPAEATEVPSGLQSSASTLLQVPSMLYRATATAHAHGHGHRQRGLFSQLLAPDPENLVLPPRGYRGAIRAPVHREYLVCMSWKVHLQLFRGHLPDLQGHLPFSALRRFPCAVQNRETLGPCRLGRALWQQA